MKIIKYFNVVLILSALVGCASTKVTLSDVNEAQRTGDYQSLNNTHAYRLDYYINLNKYSYATYEIENKNRYIELLIENGQLVAASEITRSQLYWPEIRKCTLFPYQTRLDVLACLSEFNLGVETNNDPRLFSNLRNANVEEGNRKNTETAGTFVFATLLSPILVPAAVLSSPVLMYDYNSSENTKEDFNLTLGENDNIADYLASLDAQFTSKFNGNGTAYLPSGMMDEPAVAFGFINNEIIWIQMDPYWACGGGFMFWGLKCKTGWHSK